jgi:hypothetical protein
MTTRVVRMRPELQRLLQDNSRTAMRSLESLRPTVFDAKRLFVEHFGVIRSALARHPRQGLLILAFDGAPHPVGELWLEASLDRPRAAVIGRHSLCDLMLPSEHASISLRHLAVVVRALDLHRVRVRVIDLLTGVSFKDEALRELQSLSADGPLFLRVEQIDLLLLPTPEIGGLPDDPEAAYACIPERVFLSEIEGRADPRPRQVLPSGGGLGQTIVRARPAPLMAAQGLKDGGERARGSLVVRTGGGAHRIPVGPAALERGVLIGRYDRCQLGTAGEDSGLSRVHLLLLADGDQVLAIDTASTNGTSVDGKELRIFTLADGDALDLGGELALVWSEG